MHLLLQPAFQNSTQDCLQDVPWVEGKLQEIVGIIPDLSGKIDCMKANIVTQLVNNTQASYRLHTVISLSCLFARV